MRFTPRPRANQPAWAAPPSRAPTVPVCHQACCETGGRSAIRRLLLWLTLVTILVSGGILSRGQAGQPRPAPEALSISGIHLGMTPAQVTQVLGEPPKSTILHGIGLPVWLFAMQDLEVGFSAANGVPQEVVLISVGPRSQLRTDEGVGVGSSLGEVIAAYGAPIWASGSASATFVIEDGVVIRMLIERHL